MVVVRMNEYDERGMNIIIDIFLLFSDFSYCCMIIMATQWLTFSIVTVSLLCLLAVTAAVEVVACCWPDSSCFSSSSSTYTSIDECSGNESLQNNALKVKPGIKILMKILSLRGFATREHLK